ncbi:MAG: hypothetical protein ACHQNT_12460 [Bacteroidia bacterium]
MKKIIFQLIAFIFSSSFLYAQHVAPTTDDEYTYGSVGYKIQLQTKLPMKSGYHIMDFGKYEEPDRVLAFKGLYRSDETEPCAVIMIYTKKNGPPEYFCIPSIDAPEYMWTKLYNSLNVISDNPAHELQIISYGLSRTLMRTSGNRNIEEKK